MIFTAFFAVLIYSGLLYSQTITVVDSISLQPVVNANIRSVNSNHSAVTGNDGNFSLLTFSAGDSIKITHVSYSSKILTFEHLDTAGTVYLVSASIIQPEVTVTDKLNRDAVASSEIIEFDDELKSSFINAGDALKYTSSLYIKDYGGFAGAKVLSVRGMSSENTIVLFNEARVNDLNVGLFDLSSISSASISRVEYLKNFDEEGAWSSAGGILKIFTNRKFEGRKGTAGLRYSSDKYKSALARYSDGSENLFFDLNFEHSSSPNHFNYRFNGENLKRQNAHFNRSYLNGNVVVNLKDFYISLYNNFSFLNSGIPGFVVSNNFNSSNASNGSKKYLSILNSYYYLNNKMSVNAVLSFNKQYLELFDPEGFIAIESKETNLSDVSALLKFNFIFGTLEGNIGNEFNYASMRNFSTFISSYNAPDFIKRTSDKIFSNIALPLVTTGAFIDRLVFFSKLNYELSSETARTKVNSDFLSYNLGASVVKENTTLKLQYGKTYRLPTFNEKYYSSLYNHYELNREAYISYDASIETFFELWGKTALSLSYFNISGKNKIIWIPTRLALQTPRNIAAVSSEGVEAGISKSLFNDIIEFNIFYIYTSSKNKSKFSENDLSYDKQIIYTPIHRLNSALSIKVDQFVLSVYSSFNSESFYTSDNNNSYVLPSYFVSDASLSYYFNLFNNRHSFTSTVYNLFNEEYYIIQSYPMPLRTLLISLNLEIL